MSPLLWHPHVITGYVTAVITLLVGIFVYLKKQDSKIHRAFLIFSISLTQWSFFTSLQAMQTDPKWTLVWFKFCHVGAMLIPVFFYYFTLKITGRRKPLSLNIGFVMAAIMIILNATTSLFASGVRHDVGVPNFTSAGPLYIAVLIFFASYILMSLFQLRQEIKDSTGTRKRHLRYLFMASIIGFSIGAVNFCPLYGITFWPYPYSTFCGAIYSCVIAYAIMRYKFFDMKLIVRKSMMFGILLGFVYLLVSGLSFVADLFTTRQPIPILSGISIALAMLIYEPMKTLLNFISNNLLFRGKASYTALIQTLTNRLAKITSPQMLAEEIVDFLGSHMTLEWSAFYLRSEGESMFRAAAVKGMDPSGLIQDISFMEPLLRNRRTPLIVSPFDMEGDIEYQDRLRSEKIEAVLPIFLEGSLYGILLLGQKQSDDAFSKKEEALLQTLMDELSMFFHSGKLLKKATISNLELGQRMKMVALMKLARGVHHEIRNPLHTITLFAKSTLDEINHGRYETIPIQEIAQNLVRRTNTMLEEITRIKNSLNRFAQFARPDRDFDLSPLSLKKEVNRFLYLMREGQKLDAIHVHNTIPDSIEVQGAEGVLQEVLFNLFNNAYEAMRGKGTLSLSAEAEGDSIRLKIRDTGPGIAKDVYPHIFEEYFTTKKDSESVGIGLSIAKHRLEQIKGTIEAGTPDQKGAEFIVSLKKSYEVAA